MEIEDERSRVLPPLEAKIQQEETEKPNQGNQDGILKPKDKKKKKKKTHKRPRIFDEANPARTPKPKTPARATEKKNPASKRPYVRRKPTPNPSTPSPADATEESVEPNLATKSEEAAFQHPKGIRSARRSLNFDSETTRNSKETSPIPNPASKRPYVTPNPSTPSSVDATEESVEPNFVATKSQEAVFKHPKGIRSVRRSLIFDPETAHNSKEAPSLSPRISHDGTRNDEPTATTPLSRRELIVQNFKYLISVAEKREYVISGFEEIKFDKVPDIFRQSRGEIVLEKSKPVDQKPSNSNNPESDRPNAQASRCQDSRGLVLYLPKIHKRKRTYKEREQKCNQVMQEKYNITHTSSDQQGLITPENVQVLDKIPGSFGIEGTVMGRSKDLKIQVILPDIVASIIECNLLSLVPNPKKLRSRSKPTVSSFMDCNQLALVPTPQKPISTRNRRESQLEDEHMQTLTKKRKVGANLSGILSAGSFKENSNRRVTGPQFDIIEDIIQKMKGLYITEALLDSRTRPSNNVENYGPMVLYKGESEAMVPYNGQFVQKKREKIRAKVDLDEESKRVFDLLMGKESCDSTDGLDADKEKWWEEQRRVMGGHLKLFLSCMNFIQGNRRFSQWKGSVLDSIVGVFLTQNVSDYLSSSAYMKLAANYPVRSQDRFDSQTQENKTDNPVSENTNSMGNEDKRSAEDVIVLSQGSESPDSCISSVEPIDSEETTRTRELHNHGTECKCSNPCKAFEVGNSAENNLKDGFGPQLPEVGKRASKAKAGKAEAEAEERTFNWDELRKDVYKCGANRERNSERLDSVDWEAVRRADVNEVAETIKERGQHHIIAGRIKNFLERTATNHGSIDLEWLRSVQPDKTKDYLLSIEGLGLKSVECVRLLSLNHHAFPVDTNVGRICIRLGWVPIHPLAENVPLHLIEEYPMMDAIQQYLWPRLCKFDQKFLYELHYQMITFGKVFCTKRSPNCSACPMKKNCRHYASSYASANHLLTGPEDQSLSSLAVAENGDSYVSNQMSMPHLEEMRLLQEGSATKNYEPIVEEPASPECQRTETLVPDMEDLYCPDIEDFCSEDHETLFLDLSLQKSAQYSKTGDLSMAIAVVSEEFASIPVRKLKTAGRLRTEHQVYELHDSHILLQRLQLEPRESDDPCSYLLAIWTPGEIEQSSQEQETCCNSQDTSMQCDNGTCSGCNNIGETHAQTVKGTILIPCRTAMRGSFPLNGTYFQVNEVFADHASSCKPIDVPRDLIWNLPRRTLYSGTSVTTICKGLTTEAIKDCFRRGYVCVRGFDQKTRSPKPLVERFHLSYKGSKNKRAKFMEKTDARSNKDPSVGGHATGTGHKITDTKIV